MVHGSRITRLAVVLLLSFIASSPGPGPGPRWRARRLGRSSRRRRTAAWRGSTYDPVALEGPPSPSEFTGIVGASTDQQNQYASMYEAFRQQTRGTRDSAQAVQRKLQDAMDTGNHEVIPGYVSTLDEAGTRLEKQQKGFDEEVKKLLTKDQWKKYETDQKDRRKELEEEMQKEMPAQHGGGMVMAARGRPRRALTRACRRWRSAGRFRSVGGLASAWECRCCCC